MRKRLMSSILWFAATRAPDAVAQQKSWTGKLRDWLWATCNDVMQCAVMQIGMQTAPRSSATKRACSALAAGSSQHGSKFW